MGLDCQFVPAPPPDDPWAPDHGLLAYRVLPDGTCTFRGKRYEAIFDVLAADLRRVSTPQQVEELANCLYWLAVGLEGGYPDAPTDRRPFDSVPVYEVNGTFRWRGHPQERLVVYGGVHYRAGEIHELSHVFQFALDHHLGMSNA